MSISSKISALYLLVVLFSIVNSSSEADESPNLCKSKDQDGFELKLRASLLFKKSLILIDHNWFVYDVPHSSMENSYGQMLIDIYAKPIEEYWPAFKTYKPWKDIKPNVVSIYHIDAKYPIMYMIASGITGVCYNLATSEFEEGAPVANSFESQRISDDGSLQFTITMDGQHVQLSNCNITWFESGKISHTYCYIMGNMYYTYSRASPNLKNISVINEKVDASKAISSDFAAADLDWHLPPGFVYQGKFHFFDYRNVFTFPLGPFILRDYPGNDDPMPLHATNSVIITAVKDYFKCVDLKMGTYTYPPDASSSGTGKSSYWIWIIVVIVLLLLIVALFVWCYMFRGKGKDSKLRKHSNSIRSAGTKQKHSARASSKKGNSVASKQRSSKQGSSHASKQKPSSHRKK